MKKRGGQAKMGSDSGKSSYSGSPQLIPTIKYVSVDPVQAFCETERSVACYNSACLSLASGKYSDALEAALEAQYCGSPHSPELVVWVVSCIPTEEERKDVLARKGKEWALSTVVERSLKGRDLESTEISLLKGGASRGAGISMEDQIALFKAYYAYRDPLFGQENATLARLIIAVLAEAGSSVSLRLMSKIYENGLFGSYTNPHRAVVLALKSVESGSIQGLGDVAEGLWREGNKKMAKKCWDMVKKEEFCSSSFLLGYLQSYLLDGIDACLTSTGGGGAAKQGGGESGGGSSAKKVSSKQVEKIFSYAEFAAVYGHPLAMLKLGDIFTSSYLSKYGKNEVWRRLGLSTKEEKRRVLGFLLYAHTLRMAVSNRMGGVRAQCIAAIKRQEKEGGPVSSIDLVLIFWSMMSRFAPPAAVGSHLSHPAQFCVDTLKQGGFTYAAEVGKVVEDVMSTPSAGEVEEEDSNITKVFKRCYEGWKANELGFSRSYSLQTLSGILSYLPSLMGDSRRQSTDRGGSRGSEQSGEQLADRLRRISLDRSSRGDGSEAGGEGEGGEIGSEEGGNESKKGGKYGYGSIGIMKMVSGKMGESRAEKSGGEAEEGQAAVYQQEFVGSPPRVSARSQTTSPAKPPPRSGSRQSGGGGGTHAQGMSGHARTSPQTSERTESEKRGGGGGSSGRKPPSSKKRGKGTAHTPLVIDPSVAARRHAEGGGVEAERRGGGGGMTTSALSHAMLSTLHKEGKDVDDVRELWKTLTAGTPAEGTLSEFSQLESKLDEESSAVLRATMNDFVQMRLNREEEKDLHFQRAPLLGLDLFLSTMDPSSFFSAREVSSKLHALHKAISDHLSTVEEVERLELAMFESKSVADAFYILYESAEDDLIGWSRILSASRAALRMSLQHMMRGFPKVVFLDDDDQYEEREGDGDGEEEEEEEGREGGGERRRKGGNRSSSVPPSLQEGGERSRGNSYSSLLDGPSLMTELDGYSSRADEARSEVETQKIALGIALDVVVFIGGCNVIDLVESSKLKWLFADISIQNNLRYARSIFKRLVQLMSALLPEGVKERRRKMEKEMEEEEEKREEEKRVEKEGGRRRRGEEEKKRRRRGEKRERKAARKRGWGRRR